MTDRPLAAVVLAAGQGKRMRAAGPKVLVQACGRALVEHVLDALRPLQACPTVVVFGHGGNAVQQALAGRDLLFAHQPEQRGTGHAVQCALPELGGFSGDVLILCGDTPLLTTDALTQLVGEHRQNGRALTVLSAELEDPGSLGRVVRGSSGRLEAIREINTGVMVIAMDHLAGALDRLTADNAQGELYLTDVPGLLLGDELPVDASLTSDTGAALGVNNPGELAEAVRLLRRRALDAAMAAGVWIEDPETTCIDAGAEIGAGTLVRPFTCIGPDVRIGGGCVVGPHSVLREGVVVGEGARIGAFVEVARSTIEDDAHVPGPARLVGAVVGRGAYVGPGTVTAEEADGRIVVGEHARIGAGTVLLAPVTVGEQAGVEPGTVQGGGK